MMPILIILVLAGAAITVVGGVLANWLDRPGWARPERGGARRVVMALALIVVATAAVGFAIDNEKSESNSGNPGNQSASRTAEATAEVTPEVTPSGDPSPVPSRGTSKATFLAKAEKACADHRSDVSTAMPDRSQEPGDFGAWLTTITTGNQRLLDTLAALSRPPADKDLLTDLFAQRTRANDVFLQSAGAFKVGQAVTGEQFLSSASDIEAEYRSEAKEYGFRICVGSDTPGR
ncbi:hypothetical protein [Winogradskya consettensis]|uniref:hypothetical protein n=1 Tax=Winogradskya consettensis TaxID=113560 RepID=UPI001BB32074|nr:hypothetical protein [Actinoplanes consettensis]